MTRDVWRFSRTSFFEHDGGNVYRIVNYLRLLGLRNVQPLPVVAVRDRLAEVVEMPAWPEPGAVTRLGDMIVLKLDLRLYQQQLQRTVEYMVCSVIPLRVPQLTDPDGRAQGARVRRWPDLGNRNDSID